MSWQTKGWHSERGVLRPRGDHSDPRVLEAMLPYLREEYGNLPNTPLGAASARRGGCGAPRWPPPSAPMSATSSSQAAAVRPTTAIVGFARALSQVTDRQRRGASGRHGSRPLPQRMGWKSPGRRSTRGRVDVGYTAAFRPDTPRLGHAGQQRGRYRQPVASGCHRAPARGRVPADAVQAVGTAGRRAGVGRGPALTLSRTSSTA